MQPRLLWRIIGPVSLLFLLLESSCQSRGPTFQQVRSSSAQEVAFVRPFRNASTISPAPTPASPPALSYQNYPLFKASSTWSVGGDVLKVTGIAVSAASSRVALLTLRYKEDYRLEVRDLQGKFLWDKSLGDKAAYPAIAFSPDGSLIVAGTDHGSVQLWNAATGNLVRQLGKHRYSVRVVVFSPDGSLVASGASDNEVGLWRVSTGVQIPTCFYWDVANKSKCRPQNKTDVRDLAFSPDGRFLAVSANVVVVINAATGIEADRFFDSGGETQDLAEVAFSPDGRGLAASGDWFNPENGRWRKRLLVWGFPNSPNVAKRVPIDDALEDVVFSSDGRLVLGSHKDKGVLMGFDIVSRQPVAKINLGPITLLSYSPDLKVFAVLSTKTNVSIWRVGD